MTLKQLEAFYWAATCRNFAVAAQRVNLSLSSLSKRIAELEASLGQALFDRAGHRAVLTEAGERLVPQAYSLLAAAEALRAGMAPAPAELRGRCRFGVGELSALTWLPRFVKTLGTRHPGLVVEPVVSVGAALERQLAQGDLDVAVIAGRSSHSGIASQPVAEAAFVWCAAPEVLPAGARLDAAVFARWPLVSQPAGAGTTRLIDDWLRAQRVPEVRRIDCNAWGAVAGMLVEGLGVGILPEPWARALAAEGRLVLPAARPALAGLPYALHWRRDDTRPLIAALQADVATAVDFAAARY